MFRWGVAEQLVPVEILQALSTLAPLRQGRCGAPDHVPVQPVSDKHIEKAKQHVAPQVAAIIDLQLLTGARAGELVMMRPVDLNMNGKVWTYTPHEHKTAHHGHTRTIYIGPRGQDVIRPFLSGRPVDRFLFSPQEAEKERLVLAHTSRKTPLSCGNRPGTNRVRQPQRKLRERYDVDSYRRAIQRGCDKAGTPRWHPHQLRHNAGTTVRKLEGIEVARIILGHRSPQITETYAELDHQRAIEVMAEIG